LGQGEGNLAGWNLFLRKWSFALFAVVLLISPAIPASVSAAARRVRGQGQTDVSPGISPDAEEGVVQGDETQESPASGNQAAQQPAPGNQSSAARTPEPQIPGTQGPVPETQSPEAPETAPAYDYTAPDFGENRASYPFLVLRTLAVLAVLVIVIYLVFRVFLRNRHKIVTSTEVIKVLATYPLAGNKTIQIMQIADKVLILGITDSNINLISTLEDKETIDKIKLESSKETRGFQSFKDQLIKLISGKAFGGQGQISYFNEFKQRINKMKKL
jgi:flagellar biogenesis protein FliO